MASAGWFNFLRLAVQRYGPNGTFWAANPTIPPRPIRVWQIWNEPNFKYFVTHPNPGQYGKLVKISSGAIRSIDPGAKIVLGGLFARPREAVWKVKPPQAFFAADFLYSLAVAPDRRRPADQRMRDAGLFVNEVAVGRRRRLGR